ncbi:hypothetical protein BpHYR1_022246 [Brachionus plicatilis]|uniref:Uncharacterized protein n=1 Tax=Brachionus plicatilis TaxID=10195 RepID=A0A3M7PJE4_BRAPC|nr:hypothetical protein BpHYR1_022246 [Brachionus plicatilis]
MVTIFPRKASCDTFCHIHLIIDSYDGVLHHTLISLSVSDSKLTRTYAVPRMPPLREFTNA